VGKLNKDKVKKGKMNQHLMMSKMEKKATIGYQRLRIQPMLIMFIGLRDVAPLQIALVTPS
jgi:hypothetical protein